MIVLRSSRCALGMRRQTGRVRKEVEQQGRRVRVAWTAQDALDAGGGAESISPTTTSSTDDRQERSSALASKGFPYGSGDAQQQQQGLAISRRDLLSIYLTANRLTAAAAY